MYRIDVKGDSIQNMLYIEKELTQLDYSNLVEIANSTLITNSLPKSKERIINLIIKHQKTFGESEVVNASKLKDEDYILQPIEAPLFQAQTKIAWCKVIRCYEFNATLEDIVTFQEMYSSVFLSNETPIDLVSKITNKMVQLETISTKACGKKSINCQCVVRAAVLLNFKFVRKIGISI
ncbi:hypothetical protein NIES4071_103800 (plasmid) [Calothrix sp. NIES-4071]|nr:hypothetical protein NIES4071_103800 [Calothrix sp. NIES-4071]BAZ64367.1 hypothetical protein NIES4105_101000 [Calothrix sp. NIES-4105]